MLHILRPGGDKSETDTQRINMNAGTTASIKVSLFSGVSLVLKDAEGSADG